MGSGRTNDRGVIASRMFPACGPTAAVVIVFRGALRFNSRQCILRYRMSSINYQPYTQTWTIESVISHITLSQT